MQSTPPTAAETHPNPNVVQARQSVTSLGERILVERLHRALDEGGIAGHLAFCQHTLPYLQGLIALLPQLVYDGAQQAAIDTLRQLNVEAHERGMGADEAFAESIVLYDRLRQEVVARISSSERPLVTALNQLGQTLTEIWRAAQPETTGVAVASISHLDEETGLPGRLYFEQRCGEEILRAQRTQKTLAIILLDIDRGTIIHETDGDSPHSQLVPMMASALLAQTRGFDLAARLDGDTFALLLPETNRAGAAALLGRLTRSTDAHVEGEQPLRFRVGIAVYSKDGETVHALMQRAENVLRQGAESD